MNVIVLIGRTTEDVSLTKLNNEKETVKGTVTIAVDRIGAKDGQQKADFFKLEFYGKLAENVNQYVSKGNLISVSGEMRIDDVKKQEGEKNVYHKFPKVMVKEIKFLPNKN